MLLTMLTLTFVCRLYTTDIVLKSLVSLDNTRKTKKEEFDTILILNQ